MEIPIHDDRQVYEHIHVVYDGEGTITSRTKTKYIHQLVFDLFCYNPKNLPIIDHKDRNKHNNYYKNLRPCTAEQSDQNQAPRKNCTSRFKGVSFYRNYWQTGLME